MDLIFITEARFIRGKNNCIYSVDGTFTNELWKRYLKKFETIQVVARVKYQPDYVGDRTKLANSTEVSFYDLPYYVGPSAFILKVPKLLVAIKNLPLEDTAYLLRVPGTLSRLVIRFLKKKKKKYHLEVVGDPWDVFSPGSIKTRLRFALRIYGFYTLKKTVYNASSVLYVTKNSLQKRYPIKSGHYSTFASNVIIRNFADKPKLWSPRLKWKLVSVGSLAQMYKSPDIVIKAVKTIVDNGIDCELIWLGDGSYKSQMEAFAKQLLIDPYVKFVGNVPSESVSQYLKESDIFILASRTEGLPRAIIEAMAKGLPCVATRVGGIPELLNDEVLVAPGNSDTLAQKIIELITDEEKYNFHASRNLQEAASYNEQDLNNKREMFYDQIKRID